MKEQKDGDEEKEFDSSFFFSIFSFLARRLSSLNFDLRR